MGWGGGVFLARVSRAWRSCDRPASADNLGFEADMPLKSLCSHLCCFFRQPEDVLTVCAFQEQARAQKPTPPASPAPQPAQERPPSSPVYEVGVVIRFARDSLTPWRRPSQPSALWMGLSLRLALTESSPHARGSHPLDFPSPRCVS